MNSHSAKFISCLAASIIALIAAAFVIDRIMLPYMEDRGAIAAHAWTKENKKIFDLNAMRNGACPDRPIWHSWGLKFQNKPDADRRILVMGDSFVWGDGYANANDMWWRQLDRELKRRGYNVEVMAAGYPGYSTHKELDAARLIVPDYKPDLIVWGFNSNDPDEGQVRQFTAPAAAVLKPVRKLFPNIAARMDGIVSGVYTLFLAGRDHGYPYGQWELELLRGENFERFQNTVKELANFQQKQGLPGFVVTLPQFPNAEYFARRFNVAKPVFERNGITFVDLTQDYSSEYGGRPEEGATGSFTGDGPSPGLSASEMLVKADTSIYESWGINPANPHPNACSAHFYAEKVADILEEKYRACLGTPDNYRYGSKIIVNDTLPPQYVLPVPSTKNIFDLTYPSAIGNQLPSMPGRKPFFQINFSEPVLIDQISFSGPSLEDAEIILTTEDPVKHYDTGAMIDLPSKNGPSVSWDLREASAGKPVNTIRLTARFNSGDTSLKMKLVQPGQ